MPSVSVVIPTLGGDSIGQVIASLNTGSLTPSEILICIPKDLSHLVEFLTTIPNVRVIPTVCRGQVAQRAIGFQLSTYDLVLQLDDDIRVRSDCLEHLVKCIEESGNAAVAPKMHDVTTNKYHAFLVPNPNCPLWFRKLIFWVLNGRNGYRPGQIGRAGIGMGVPEFPNDWDNLAWLPGGCILHTRSNLILYDYYQLKGKAFAEDLFHSVLMRAKGVKLVRCGLAISDVDFSNNEKLSVKSKLRWYRNYMKAMHVFVRQNGGNSFFLYTFLLLSLGAHLSSKFMAAVRSSFWRSNP